MRCRPCRWVEQTRLSDGKWKDKRRLDCERNLSVMVVDEDDGMGIVYQPPLLPNPDYIPLSRSIKLRVISWNSPFCLGWWCWRWGHWHNWTQSPKNKSLNKIKKSSNPPHIKVVFRLDGLSFPSMHLLKHLFRIIVFISSVEERSDLHFRWEVFEDGLQLIILDVLGSVDPQPSHP